MQISRHTFKKNNNWVKCLLWSFLIKWDKMGYLQLFHPRELGRLFGIVCFNFPIPVSSQAASTWAKTWIVMSDCPQVSQATAILGLCFLSKKHHSWVCLPFILHRRMDWAWYCLLSIQLLLTTWRLWTWPGGGARVHTRRQRKTGADISFMLLGSLYHCWIGLSGCVANWGRIVHQSCLACSFLLLK